MKLISASAFAALVGAGIFTLALLLGQNAADTFAFAAVGLLLVTMVRDYSPRRPRWEIRRHRTNRPHATHGRNSRLLKAAA